VRKPNLSNLVGHGVCVVVDALDDTEKSPSVAVRTAKLPRESRSFGFPTEPQLGDPADSLSSRR
jgi:hypothetical protein